MYINNLTLVLLLSFNIGIIVASTILIIFVQGYVDNLETSYLTQLGLNWSLPPIVYIKPKLNNCDKNDINMLEDYFPGTTEGCECYDYIRVGSCDKGKNSKEKHCKSILETHPIKYTRWGDYLLCGKRANYNYFDITIVDKLTECPSNFINCGYIDTLYNKMCLDKSIDQKCPINEIMFNSIHNNKELELSSNIISYFNEKTDRHIISSFKIDQDIPCINPKYYNSNSKHFKLSKIDINSPCPDIEGLNYKHELNSELLDEESLNYFYDVNGITQKLNQITDKYKDPNKNDKIKLYSNVYKGINLECKNNILKKYPSYYVFLEHLISFNANKTLMSKFIHSSNIGNIVSMIISIVFTLFYLLINCCENNNKAKLFKYYVSLISVIYLIIICFNVSAFKVLYDMPNDYSLLANSYCTNKEIKIFAKNFQTNINQATTTSTIALIISIIGYFIYEFSLRNKIIDFY